MRLLKTCKVIIKLRSELKRERNRSIARLTGYLKYEKEIDRLRNYLNHLETKCFILEAKVKELGAQNDT